MNQNGKKGAIAYNMDQKKQVSMMFITSSGNLTEVETTPLSQAICNLEYRQLTQSITVHVVPKILLSLLQLILVTFVWLSVPDKN